MSNSERSKDKVPEHATKAMSPVEDSALQWDVFQPFVDQRNHLQEELYKQVSEMMVLTLRCLDAIWIEIDGFQSSEAQFSWSCIITVGPGEDDRQLLGFEVLDDGLGLVVAGVVQLEDVILPPTRPLFVQLHDEMLEEQNQRI